MSTKNTFREETIQIQVVGLRIEKYVGTSVQGHNCKFEESKKEFERHILFANIKNKDFEKKKLSIEFSITEGECYSGWCSSTEAEVKLELLDHHGGYTHVAKNPIGMSLDVIWVNNGQKMALNWNYNGYDYKKSGENQSDESPGLEFRDYKCDLFHVSPYGGDSYYPQGFYTVNMKMFNETVRHRIKRPVWIFQGESTTGKDILAHKLKKLNIFETDSVKVLPDVIIEDVVVMGDQNDFQLEDVKKRLFGDVDVIVVDFKVDQLKK